MTCQFIEFYEVQCIMDVLTGLWRLEFEAYTKILSFLPFELVFLINKIRSLRNHKNKKVCLKTKFKK